MILKHKGNIGKIAGSNMGKADQRHMIEMLNSRNGS